MAPPSSTTNSAPFHLVAAFSSDPFSGNPAAVVFIDPDTTPTPTLQGLAQNFNAPMIAFVKPITSDSFSTSSRLAPTNGPNADPTNPAPLSVQTRIRFMTFTGQEIALCGHASIAAASVIRGLPIIANEGPLGLVEFTTYVNSRVVPVRVVQDALEEDAVGGPVLLEMGLPTFPRVEVSDEEGERIKDVVRRAFGLGDDEEGFLVDVKAGGKGMEHALLVELDARVGLANAKVDLSIINTTGYTQNIITSIPLPSSPESQFEYIYRMFSPAVPGGEDAVCGSAQCLLAPYWYLKKGLVKGKEVPTKSVSSRGGIVKILWEGTGEKEVVQLRGLTRVLASGESYF